MTTKSTRWTKSSWRPCSSKVCDDDDDDDDDDDYNNNNYIDGVNDEGDCDVDMMLAVMMMMTMRVMYLIIETLHGDEECHVF